MLAGPPDSSISPRAKLSDRRLGITNTGAPLCINDALTNNPAGYHQLCLGANAFGGGVLSYNAVGGATELPLQLIVNGVTTTLPGNRGAALVGCGTMAAQNGGRCWRSRERHDHRGVTITGHASLDLAIANNLSDVANAATARTNLGLGTIATQNANTVAITGGTVVLPGGFLTNSILVGAQPGGTPSSNWLENFINSPNTSGPVYGIKLGPATSVSQSSSLNSGGFGSIGGASTTDCGTFTCDAFGVGAFAINNNQQGGAAYQSVWSYFGVAVALPGASTVGSGFTHGIEQDVVNKGLAGQPGAAPLVMPYQVAPLYATIGGIFASGSGSANATEQGLEGPASVALEITSNFSGTAAASGTPTWKTGIVFSSTSLTGGTGIDGDTTIRDAISLPRIAGINFWNAGNTTQPGSSIYSAVTSGTAFTDNIRFDNTGVIFETNNGFGAGVEGLVITPSASGTCYEEIANGVGLTVVQNAGSASSCTQFWGAKGASGSHIFQVNGSGVVSFSATGPVFSVFPTSGGGGGLYVCRDPADGHLYDKASCP